MNCSTARECLLEADVQELRGDGGTELARHLGSCVRCRAIAERVLQHQQGLARLLDQENPRTDTEKAIRTAQLRAREIQRRRAVWRTAVPLAAAAGIAGVVLQSSGSNGLEYTWQPQVEQSLPAFEVQASRGKDVAVFEVADRPDVVVVWFFERGDD